MPFDSRSVANYFITLAESRGHKLTPMKLQKLVYFAQGWSLALTGTSLIDEQIEAWKYGPVIRSLYRACRPYGDGPITSPVSYPMPREKGRGGGSYEWIDVTPTIDDKPEEAARMKPLLDRIWEIYGKFSGIQLSNLTHQAGTPWHQIYEEYRGDIPKGTDIPTPKIKAYFESLKSSRNLAS